MPKIFCLFPYRQSNYLNVSQKFLLKREKENSLIVFPIYYLSIPVPNLLANCTTLHFHLPQVHTAKKQTKKNQASDLTYKCSQRMTCQPWGFELLRPARNPTEGKRGCRAQPEVTVISLRLAHTHQRAPNSLLCNPSVGFGDIWGHWNFVGIQLFRGTN